MKTPLEIKKRNLAPGRKSRFLLFSFFICFILLAVNANKTFASNGVNENHQQSGKDISGIVKDASGETIIGATVSIDGTQGGTITDIDGNFSLKSVKDTDVLRISFIGYKTQLITVGDKKIFQITMEEDSKLLKEVVVSYGTQKEKEISGSVTAIDMKSMQDMPVTQFAQQLQGKVAGMQVSQTSGQPGRGMAFRIRGSASLSSGNTPLFVVDGMPVTGSINNINPSEIESMSVLKDASASALYGSRAANGVILITTKQAHRGSPRVEFNANYGIQTIPGKAKPKMMNAQEFAQFMKERHEDRLKYEIKPGDKIPELDAVYQNPEQYANSSTDWYDLLTRTAPVQSYDISISSNKDNSSTLVMAGYQKQEGVIINTDTELFSLRFNQTYRLHNNKINIGVNFAPSYRIDHNNRMTSDGVGGLIEKASEASPILSPYEDDGTYRRYVNTAGMVNNMNPYAQYMLTQDDYTTTRLLGNASFKYLDIIDGLAFKANIGVDMGKERRDYFIPGIITSNKKATGTASNVDNYSYTAEAMLEYTKSFGNHNINALVGYSAQKFDQRSTGVTGTDYLTDDIPYLEVATQMTSGYSRAVDYSLLSYIARINYNYQSKYIISASIRRDGSSRFGSDKRYGSFPAVSVGWSLGDEEFIKNIYEFDMLKLRASYGLTGNNNIGNYTHISQTGSSSYVVGGALAPGMAITTLGNVVLGWERSKQFDFGIDISLFDNKLSFTYDYYHKRTDGLIDDRPIPQASGYDKITSNIGELKFWGHEFTVGFNHNFGELKWNSSFNISFDRNKVVDLVAPGYKRRNNTISSDYYRNQIGMPLGMFYGFVFEGLYKDAADVANSPKQTTYTAAEGTAKFADVDGNEIVDNEDRTFIGDPNPDFLFGFSNEFEYKNFSLSLTLTGSYGNDIIMPARWPYMANLDGARNVLAEAKDRWRSPENPGSGKYGRTLTGSTVAQRNVNSQWVEDGSYLSCKNITLGYTFNLKPDWFIKRLRVYTSAQNLFVITSYPGGNPEISLSGLDGKAIGIDENAYPVPRTISFGLNLAF